MAPIGRRSLLALGAAGAAALTVGAVGATADGGRSRSAVARRRISGPFTLGVASGEPTPDGIVLWTRLAPDPLAGGGMPHRPVTVRWEVATDDTFRHTVAHGEEVARPELAHSVHAEVGGLRPATSYAYRFRTGSELSPVGRTRTAPARGARVDALAFALTSCQDWASGWFTGHRHMSEEDLDLVVQVGDYIYERPADEGTVRVHEGVGEPVELADYRNRHAQYRTDGDLQACHAAFPWLVVLDDHEIADGWADDMSQEPHEHPRGAFAARRAAALRAYYEHMPLRRSSMPRGVDVQLYRRATFGDLLDVHLLDTRQYRSDQDAARRLDPSRTMLGDTQARWLVDALAGPTARWNAIVQQVLFSQRDLAAGPAQRFMDDGWDGYAHARDALRDELVQTGAANPVILTGDVHATYVCDVKADFADPSSPTVATELAATSMTSGGDAAPQDPGDAVLLAENPHIRFVNHQRGYVRHLVTPEAWFADHRVLDRVSAPGSAISTCARFVVEDGRAGAVAV